MRNLRLLFATLAVVFFLSACTSTESGTISMAEAESIMPGTYKVYFYGEALGAGMYCAVGPGREGGCVLEVEGAARQCET